LAVLLLCCANSIPHASARVMARKPAAEAAPATVPSTEAAAAAGRPVEGQVLVAVPDAAAKVAASTVSNAPAAQRAREAARQARATAQGKTLTRPATRPTTTIKPLTPTAVAAAAGTTAPARRSAGKAAAAAGAGVVTEAGSRAGAAAKSHVQEGLPPMTPLQLLFGDSKYTNPQVKQLGDGLILFPCCNLSSPLHPWLPHQPSVLPYVVHQQQPCAHALRCVHPTPPSPVVLTNALGQHVDLSLYR
jgi:hypothetical protein